VKIVLSQTTGAAISYPLLRGAFKPWRGRGLIPCRTDSRARLRMCHLSSTSCNRRKHNAPPIQCAPAVAWQALSFREVLAMINVRKTQEALAKAGYAPGPLDGNWGPSTCTALLAQQAQRQPDAMLRALGRAAAAELPRHGIIDSPARLAEWLAQTGNETGGYTRFEENLRYSARRLLEIWPSASRRWPKPCPMPGIRPIPTARCGLGQQGLWRPHGQRDQWA
jgi:hypothetical protein